MPLNRQAYIKPNYRYETSELAEIYKKALKRIEEELYKFDPENEWQQAFIRARLASITEILMELDEASRKWVEERIPEAARQGVAAAMLDLGMFATVDAALKAAQFNTVNKQLVEALIADTMTNVLAVTQNTERRIRSKIREVTSAVLREKASRGITSHRPMKKDILANLRKELGSALDTGIIDAAGRRWKPEVYVQLLAHTKLMEAHIEAQRNQAIEMGAFYGLISSHGAKDACRFHEGRIVKLAASAPGYYPTLDQLRATNQIFHPNCKHHVIIINDPRDLPPDVLRKAERQHEIGERAIATGRRNPADGLVRQTSVRRQTVEEIERSFRSGADVHLRAIQAQAKRKVEAFTGKRKPFEVKVWERIAKGINGEKDLRDVGKMIDDAITDAAKRVRAKRDKLLKERDKYDDLARKYHEEGKYKERDKALAKSDELTEKALALNKEIVKLESKNGEAYLEYLSKIRPFGPGKHVQQWHALTDMQAQKYIEAAFKYLPRDWVALSSQTQLYAELSPRGYFMQAKGHRPSMIAVDRGGVQTALHEMGHRMEWMRPGIMEMEDQFYRRRTQNKSEPLRWLGPPYGKHEVTRVDHFTHPYMGKDYGDGFYELLTMGLEGVFFGAHNLRADKDMLYFILGMLATL